MSGGSMWEKWSNAVLAVGDGKMTFSFWVMWILCVCVLVEEEMGGWEEVTMFGCKLVSPEEWKSYSLYGTLLNGC